MRLLTALLVSSFAGAQVPLLPLLPDSFSVGIVGDNP